MGLPQLDFRVPEATRFKSVLASRFPAMPGLSSTGAVAWPYKIAVVAVMALVACGTLVTFGTAQAETPSSAELAALPGTDEARPSVEGQVLPPASPGLLNSTDLLSSLNLTDYSPFDTTLGLTDEDDDDDDEDSDEDSDEETTAAIKKRLAANKPTPGSKTPTTSPTTPAPKPTNKPTTPAPTPTQTSDPDPVEGPRHKRWENCTSSDVNKSLGICGSEPDFED